MARKPVVGGVRTQAAISTILGGDRDSAVLSDSEASDEACGLRTVRLPTAKDGELCVHWVPEDVDEVRNVSRAGLLARPAESRGRTRQSHYLQMHSLPRSSSMSFGHWVQEQCPRIGRSSSW